MRPSALFLLTVILLAAPGAVSGAEFDVAAKVLPGAAAPDELDAAWDMLHPELADAVDYLARFPDAGAASLRGEPPLPDAVQIHAREVITLPEGEGSKQRPVPRHYVFINPGPNDYAGRVWIPTHKRLTVGFHALWQTGGAVVSGQVARKEDTALVLELPARSALVLRPGFAVRGGKGATVAVKDIRMTERKLEVDFSLDPNESAGLGKMNVAMFLMPRAQIELIHANGVGVVSFAPMEGQERIRPIPFTIDNPKTENRLSIDCRPMLWFNIDPERLRSFPVYKLARGQWKPRAPVCVDDEPTGPDLATATRLAEAFAAPGLEPPRSPLPVVKRADADGMGGARAPGGPHRVSLGPRDSLLFPHFGFNPDEHRHVLAGGALACMADDPDGYKVIYLVGKTEEDRAAVARRLILELRRAGALD